MAPTNLTDQEKALLEGTLKMMLDVLDNHTTRIKELETKISQMEAIIKGR